ncbi:hypothetical protein DFH29DRAFT_877753 [Suillus ampliporus]|nr:hypothetical protein DFH29DRAFT_877753 [Suillus ampliporus]
MATHKPNSSKGYKNAFKSLIQTFLWNGLVCRRAQVKESESPAMQSNPQTVSTSEPSQQPQRPRRRRVFRRPKVLGYVTTIQWLYEWGLEHNLQVYIRGELHPGNTISEALRVILKRANGAATHQLVLDPTSPGDAVLAIIIANDVRPSPPEKVERRKQVLKAIMEITEDPTWLDASS